MMGSLIACGVFFLTLFAPGCALSAGWNRRCEECLPAAGCGVIVILYLFGLAGLMAYGTAAVLLACAACYGFALWRILTKRISLRAFGLRVCTPAMALFALFFIIAMVCNYGRMPYHGDEFSHWAYGVKAMTHLNDFAANPASASLYGSYPPAMQLLQYYVQKLNGFFIGSPSYRDWLLFVSYQVFGFSLFLPFFKNLHWRQAGTAVLLGAAAFLLPLIWFPLFYESTFIDPIIGMLAAYCLAAVWRAKSGDGWQILFICLALCVMTLSKDAGLLFALVCGCAFMVRTWAKPQSDGLFTQNRKRGLVTLAAAAAIGVPKLSWNGLLERYGTVVRFSKPVEMDQVWAFLSGHDTATYRETTLDALGARFFGPGCPFGATNLTLFGKTLPSLSFAVPYLLVFLALIGGLWLAARREPKRIGLMWTVSIGTAVYLVGLAGLYLFQMYDFEAVELWCFDRYIGIVLMMLSGLGLMLLASRDSCCARDAVMAQTPSPQKNMGHPCPGWGAAVTLVCVLLLCPLQNAKTYLTRQSAKGSAEIMAPTVALAERIIDLAGTTDKVFLIAQGNDGEGIGLKYMLYPHLLNGASIGPKWYHDDAFAMDITVEAWQTLLVENGYRYVVLERLNDAFIKNCAPAFVDPSEIAQGELYSVDPATGMLRLAE